MLFGGVVFSLLLFRLPLLFILLLRSPLPSCRHFNLLNGCFLFSSSIILLLLAYLAIVVDVEENKNDIALAFLYGIFTRLSSVDRNILFWLLTRITMIKTIEKKTHLTKSVSFFDPLLLISISFIICVTPIPFIDIPFEKINLIKATQT